MSTALQLRHVVKTFGPTRALDGLDLSVEHGEIHGFLGPNGAGKSTTLRILLGLLKADSGTVRVLDADPWAEPQRLHRELSYIPGEVSLWPNLTGGQVIDLLTRLHGRPDPARRRVLLERFELDPTKRCRSYSKGNRQKVALVAALANRASLYIFDEPTSGLDPLMEEVFERCVQELRDQGATVLLSSHILSEVERLSDRISIIRQGHIVRTASLDQMRALHATAVSATLAGPVSGLGALPGVRGLRVTGERVDFSVDAAHLDAAIALLGRAGIRSLVSQPPSLEELFLHHYGDQPAGGSR
ncbi:ABC transporter ATP-binding protein [Propionibacterium cyclohexanicum]|nr:ABC transporter ATP-binding protein [Propionibacterium cyclohexanicum]